METNTGIKKLKRVHRTFDLLAYLVESHPDKQDMLCKMVKGKWIKFSTQDYYRYSHLVAYAMLSLGYGKEDKAITITANRPEWNFLDMGLNLAGMIHVPVYPTLSPDEFIHIFTHSDAKVIFVGNTLLLSKVNEVLPRIDREIKVILMDDSDEMMCLRDLYKLGKEAEESQKENVEKVKSETSPNQCCSIIYTSGTTGIPKGVMLSHDNLMFNAYGHAIKQTFTDKHKMVSFLPLCHVYERSMNYEYQYVGIGIYYAENLATIARDIADCHADGFCGVPRVLEKMYGKFETGGNNLKGWKKSVYQWAWNFGNTFDNYNHSPLYKFKHLLADTLVYSKWREKLGGHEMLVVSGGSSIPAKIVRLFNASKLHIYEGYGMTEASPVIAVNSPAQGFNVIGTVGKKLEGTELKFAEDGEILTKGPHVMLGYYKNPEATKEIIDKDGYLHTGDIGKLIDGEYLKITDRKKEIFKLCNGKYVAPQVLESLIHESEYFANGIILGENEKFVSAIILPNFEKIEDFARKNGINIEEKEALLENPVIINLLHSEIEHINQKLSPHEQIKREKFTALEWSTQNGLLSQTLKLKRAAIHKKYATEIADIFKSE